MNEPDAEELARRVHEHLHTILTEVRALNDLHQRTGDHLETLTRRLYRHFDAGPGGGKTDYRLAKRWISTGRRDDEDDGGD